MYVAIFCIFFKGTLHGRDIDLLKQSLGMTASNIQDQVVP